MATRILVDTTSAQTLTGPKTLTNGIITGGVVALAAAPTATLDAATKGYVDGLNIMPLNNGSLSASVATNILTLRLTTAGGATPSASDPVRATFRNSTDADGSLTTRTITAATSMTFASGSTIGTANGVAARIWVGLLDNAGTVEVCAWNPVKSVTGPPLELSLKAFTPNTDVTTTAEGSGTATSAHTLYSTNARSSVPFILLGFIEITEATAGVWATSPSVVLTYRDGMRKTGDIVQEIAVATGAVATGTTLIPYDDTIPQITEGDQYMSVAIIPTSAINVIRLSTIAQLATGPIGVMIQALFQDAVANALAAKALYEPGVNSPVSEPLSHVRVAGTTSSITYRYRAGGTSAGTVTFNGQSGLRLFGGVCNSIMIATELTA